MTANHDLIRGIRDIAAELDVSEGTVNRWIRDRQIPAFKLGGRVVVRRADLDAMISERAARAQAEMHRPLPDRRQPEPWNGPRPSAFGNLLVGARG